MYSTKTLLKAATFALLAATGFGISGAAAAPWDHHRGHDRGWYRHERMNHYRSYVTRLRVADALRFHHYRVISDPFFFHGRYVVRSHDRFGRPVLVQVDPYTGAFIRVL
jgi:hypothetical protein